MNKFYFWDMRWCLVMVLGFAVLGNAGCEPLRKKFIRKKKTDEVNQSVAILDPVDYPEKVRTAAQLYEECYAMWNIWLDELETNIISNAGDKKVRSTLGQIKERLTALQTLLKQGARLGVDRYLQRIEELDHVFEGSPAMRNKDLILSNIRSLGKDVRNHYSPRMVGDQLNPLQSQ